jgi:hypothetical protein
MPPRGKCGHCGKGGDLQETYYGANTAWLHRDCQAGWAAGRDLDTPSYLEGRDRSCMDGYAPEPSGGNSR